MKKFTFGALACIAACTIAFAGCAKNKDGCCNSCDKAAVKSTEGTAQPASGEGKDCSKSCSDKKGACTGASGTAQPASAESKKDCSSSCSGKKMSCTGAEGTAQAASAETKKSGCGAAKTCSGKNMN